MCLVVCAGLRAKPARGCAGLAGRGVVPPMLQGVRKILHSVAEIANKRVYMRRVSRKISIFEVNNPIFSIK